MTQKSTNLQSSCSTCQYDTGTMIKVGVFAKQQRAFEVLYVFLNEFQERLQQLSTHRCRESGRSCFDQWPYIESWLRLR